MMISDQVSSTIVAKATQAARGEKAKSTQREKIAARGRA